ncbi:MAG: hypothetical protein ACM30H_08015 [Clostridia bacterium]
MNEVRRLTERRATLQERAAHERMAIAAAFAPLQGADRLLSRAWPLAGAVAAIALFRRPRGLGRWLRYAVAARQLWNFFKKA